MARKITGDTVKLYEKASQICLHAWRADDPGRAICLREVAQNATRTARRAEPRLRKQLLLVAEKAEAGAARAIKQYDRYRPGRY